MTELERKQRRKKLSTSIFTSFLCVLIFGCTIYASGGPRSKEFWESNDPWADTITYEQENAGDGTRYGAYLSGHLYKGEGEDFWGDEDYDSGDDPYEMLETRPSLFGWIIAIIKAWFNKLGIGFVTGVQNLGDEIANFSINTILPGADIQQSLNDGNMTGLSNPLVIFGIMMWLITLIPVLYKFIKERHLGSIQGVIKEMGIAFLAVAIATLSLMIPLVEDSIADAFDKISDGLSRTTDESAEFWQDEDGMFTLKARLYKSLVDQQLCGWFGVDKIEDLNVEGEEYSIGYKYGSTTEQEYTSNMGYYYYYRSNNGRDLDKFIDKMVDQDTVEFNTSMQKTPTLLTFGLTMMMILYAAISLFSGALKTVVIISPFVSIVVPFLLLVKNFRNTAVAIGKRILFFFIMYIVTLFTRNLVLIMGLGIWEISDLLCLLFALLMAPTVFFFFKFMWKKASEVIGVDPIPQGIRNLGNRRRDKKEEKRQKKLIKEEQKEFEKRDKTPRNWTYNTQTEAEVRDLDEANATPPTFIIDHEKIKEIDEKFDELDEKTEEYDKKFEGLKDGERLKDKFNEIEDDVDEHGKKLEDVDKQDKENEKKFKDIDEESGKQKKQIQDVDDRAYDHDKKFKDIDEESRKSGQRFDDLEKDSRGYGDKFREYDKDKASSSRGPSVGIPIGGGQSGYSSYSGSSGSSSGFSRSSQPSGYSSGHTSRESQRTERRVSDAPSSSNPEPPRKQERPSGLQDSGGNNDAPTFYRSGNNE